MQSTLEIRRMTLDGLRLAPYNPRRMPKPGDPAYEKLAASLREFGLVEPLVWNETTGYVVGGHLRLSILRQMGVETVPVSVVRLEPAREKALNVILNNREAQGRFDPLKLAELLNDLKDLPELQLTGFDARNLAALQLEPLSNISRESSSDEVEVTLSMPRGRYESFAPRLDALIAEFDLRCHVRR